MYCVSNGLGVKMDWQCTPVKRSSSNLLEFALFIIKRPCDQIMAVVQKEEKVCVRVCV